MYKKNYNSTLTMLKTLLLIVLLFAIYHGIKTIFLTRNPTPTDKSPQEKSKQLIRELEKTKTQLTTKENQKMAEEIDRYFRDHYPLIS